MFDTGPEGRNKKANRQKNKAVILEEETIREDGQIRHM
jgi:hypothetical protein